MPDVTLVFDDISILESTSGAVGHAINVFDTASVAEFSDRTDGLLFIISNIIDNIAVVEAPTVRPLINVSILENTVIVDDASFPAAVLAVSRVVNVFDLVAVVEFVRLGRNPELIDVFDSITIVESPLLGMNPLPIPTVFDLVSISEVALRSLVTDTSFTNFLRSYPFIEETIFNVLTEVFENGSEQRRDKWGRSRKRFTLTFSPRSKTEMDAIKAFYDDKSGSGLGFNFINPLDSVSYVVRFEANSLQVSRTAFGIYEAQVTVVEVF